MNLAIKRGQALNFLCSSRESWRIQVTANLLVLGLLRVWRKMSSSMNSFSTPIQQCKGLMGNQTERRRELNISIDFCIYRPLLTGSLYLKVTAITSLEAEGRKQRQWVKRLAHSQAVSSPVFSALVVGNRISAGHLIFLVIMFLMFSVSWLPAQPFFSPEK